MSEDGTTPGPARGGAAPGDDGEAPVTSIEGQHDEQVSIAETGEDENTGDGRTPAYVPPPRPDTTSDPMPGGAPVGRLRRRIPQVLALAVVWVLLWGSLSPVAIVGGLLIGAAVTMLFPLPLLPERLPFRPVKVLRLIGFLALDLVISGVRVSMVTLRFGPRAKSGIIGLPLYTASDRVVTTIVAGCALTPGSYALQIDRRRGRWYVYALGLRRAGAVDRVRRDMLNLQMRVIDAIGSDDDVRRCRAAVVDAAESRDTGREPQ